MLYTTNLAQLSPFLISGILPKRNLGISLKKIFYYLSHIKQFFGDVVGDSKPQHRGVAHYLLPLTFSLVSLPLTLYFCLPLFYQKVQKNICLVSSCFSLLLLAW